MPDFYFGHGNAVFFVNLMAVGQRRVLAERSVPPRETSGYALRSAPNSPHRPRPMARWIYNRPYECCSGGELEVAKALCLPELAIDCAAAEFRRIERNLIFQSQ